MYIDDDRSLLACGSLEVKEQLLRKVVQYTDHYATDLLIYFEHRFLELTVIPGDESVMVRNLYIRQMGVDWCHDDGNEEYKPPKQHRYHLQIVKSDGQIKLYGELGNC